MKSPTVNYGIMRFTNTNSTRTNAARVSSSHTINLAPARLTNTEAATATVSAPLSSSWKTSISTDSVRRDANNMRKVRGLVAQYETKAKAASEAQVSKGNVTVSSAKSVKDLIKKFSA